MSRNAVLFRPQWVIQNQLTMPLLSYTNNNKASVRGLIQVIVPFTIFLDTLFDSKSATGRSENEQFRIFKVIEGALQSSGIDGKSCLLRTICELQKNPISRGSIVGEMVTVMLTPHADLSDKLHDYLEAEHLGRTNGSCAVQFPACPVSLFNLFGSYSTPADKPVISSVSSPDPVSNRLELDQFDHMNELDSTK